MESYFMNTEYVFPLNPQKKSFAVVLTLIVCLGQDVIGQG